MSKKLACVLWSLVAAASAPIVAQSEPPRVLTPREVVDTVDEQELRWPVGIAVSEGRLGVADAFGSRLLIFTRAGVSWALEHEVALPAPPVDATRVGDVWVISLVGAKELITIDDTGRTGAAVPLPAGAVAGSVATVDSSSLLVYDVASSTVIELDRRGAVSRRVEVDGFVTALVALGDGGVLAAVGDQGQLLRFDAAGQRIASWDLADSGPVPAWPSGLASGNNGGYFVVDQHGGQILVLDEQGRWIGKGSGPGRAPGFLHRPAAVTLTSSGELLVADLGNGRVQVFTVTERF